jgi:hypothetical protein
MNITSELDASAPDEDRKRAAHPSRSRVYLPKWLLNPNEAQAIAHGRCLMILAVLSGQKTVKEVIEEQKICRTLYYQLESKALRGMVRALNPTTSEWTSDRRELKRAQARIRALTVHSKLLMQRKRSLERLLRLMVKSSQVQLNTARPGRRPKALSQWMMHGADLR